MDIKFDFEKVNVKDVMFWPIWLKAIGVSVIVVIIFVLGTYFYILPSVDSGEKLDKEIERLKKDYKTKFIEQQKLEKYSEILAKRDDYSVLEKLIPNEPKTIQFVKETTAFARQRRVNLKVIDPLDMQQSKIKEFKVMPISITGEAGYINLVNFLTDLINMGRLVTFEDLTITVSDTQEGQLSFELILHTYFKQPKTKKK